MLRMARTLSGDSQQQVPHGRDGRPQAGRDAAHGVCEGRRTQRYHTTHHNMQPMWVISATTHATAGMPMLDWPK